MTRWEVLRSEIESVRGRSKLPWETELIKALGRLTDKGFCDSHERYRVKRRNHAVEIEPRAGATMPTVKAHVPAILLKELPHLDEPKLAFRIALHRDGRLEQYTMSLVGKDKSTGAPWYVRIDLDDEQKGEGPCGHPLLHAHIGSDPSNKHAQPVRVPLPWLAPHDALEWMLANVAPALEPPATSPPAAD